MISVMVIEDNRLVREGLSSLLNKTEEINVVLAVANAGAEVAAAMKPDVVLVDVGLQDDDSLRVVERVKQLFPDAGVIVMDFLPLDVDIVEFENAGASGFILKDATLADLISTITLVARGTHVLPLEIDSTLFAEIARTAMERAPAEAINAVRITTREQEVVNLISEGLSNNEIAARLSIATHTVKSHVRNVMEKLALHTRLQIAAYSHRQDIHQA